MAEHARQPGRSAERPARRENDTAAVEQIDRARVAIAGLVGSARPSAPGTPTVQHRRDSRPGSDAVAALRAASSRPGAVPATVSDPVSDELRAAVVQRLAGPVSGLAGGAVPQDPEPLVRRVLRSPGKPLGSGVRAEMETAFGADFSTVRLHDDSSARESAQALGARAYTAGENVVLGSGGADKHTLAHELAHVVQQRTGPVAGAAVGSGLLRVSHPDDSFEQAAEATAAKVVAGHQAPGATAAGSEAAGPAAAGSEAAGPAAAGSAVDAPSIQRKVGFEFETNLQVYSNDAPLIAKNVHIFDSTDGSWYITPDGGTFEFVTKAFQEEGDNPELQQMRTTVGQMAEAFSMLHDMTKLSALSEDPTPLGPTLGDYGAETPYAGHTAYVPGDIRLYPPNAVPQATGGVSLAKMMALFDRVVALQFGLESPANPEAALYGDEPEAREDSYAVGVAEERVAMARARVLATTYCQEATEELEDDIDTAGLEGLLLLTYTYLLAGANQRARHDQAKYFLPLMSRMSFSAMYSSLTEEAKALFKDADILQLVDLPGGDPLYKHGFKDPADDHVDKGPTRADWLASIRTDAADKMSFGGSSNVAQGMRASSSAMGQYGALDAGLTAEAAKLVQIELRRLPKSVPPEEWIVIAEALFTMFRAVQS